jgi:hypothetical protein
MVYPPQVLFCFRTWSQFWIFYFIYFSFSLQFCFYIAVFILFQLSLKPVPGDGATKVKVLFL